MKNNKEELLNEIEKWSEKYKFNFQFWGREENNVYVYKDSAEGPLVEIFSYGGRDTIEELLADTLNKIYRMNRVPMEDRVTKKRMTVKDLFEEFTINPATDIEPYFYITKILNEEYSGSDMCYKCGDTNNQVDVKSSPWTSVQFCWKCNHVNVVHHQDRMAGTYYDIIKCYTDKDEH